MPINKKGFLLIATVALMIGGIDIYLAALPMLVTYFDTSVEFMQFTVMISPLISAVVSFIWGRQADLRCRKRLMLLALSFFGVGAMVCGMATSKWVFLLGRFIQSIGGSGLSNISVVFLYDIFTDKKEHARYIAWYGVMFPVVFAISPIVGAQILEHLNWRFCFGVIVILSILLFIGYAVLFDKTIAQKDPHPHAKQNALRRLRGLLSNKLFVVLCMGHSLPISVSMLFTSNSAFIFQNYYGLHPTIFTYVQCLPIMLNFAGTFYYQYILQKYNVDYAIKIAGYSVIAFIFGLLYLFISQQETYIAFLCVMGIFMFFMSFSISSCATKAIESQKTDRGLAIAVLSTSRNAIGGGIVVLSSIYYDTTPDPLYLSMMLTSGLLVVFLLMVYPRMIRMNQDANTPYHATDI